MPPPVCIRFWEAFLHEGCKMCNHVGPVKEKKKTHCGCYHCAERHRVLFAAPQTRLWPLTKSLSMLPTVHPPPTRTVTYSRRFALTFHPCSAFHPTPLHALPSHASKIDNFTKNIFHYCLAIIFVHFQFNFSIFSIFN